MAPMPTPPPPPIDHRRAALDALERSKRSREAIAREYLRAPSARDYDRIADHRTAIRAELLEAQVHATLAASVVVATDNAHDARQADRMLDLAPLRGE